jgi:hypothetical protein
VLVLVLVIGRVEHVSHVADAGELDPRAVGALPRGSTSATRAATRRRSTSSIRSRFDPVTTTKLRISMQGTGTASVGVVQWVVPSIPS